MNECPLHVNLRIVGSLGAVFFTLEADGDVLQHRTLWRVAGPRRRFKSGEEMVMQFSGDALRIVYEARMRNSSSYMLETVHERMTWAHSSMGLKTVRLQGYLAYKETPTPLGPP